MRSHWQRSHETTLTLHRAHANSTEQRCRAAVHNDLLIRMDSIRAAVSAPLIQLSVISFANCIDLTLFFFTRLRPFLRRKKWFSERVSLFRWRCAVKRCLGCTVFAACFFSTDHTFCLVTMCTIQDALVRECRTAKDTYTMLCTRLQGKLLHGQRHSLQRVFG